MSPFGYSFNPSYTGYATGRPKVWFYCETEDVFQSFLYWICYWKKSIGQSRLPGVQVSILLILDMLLEDYQSQEEGNHNVQRFNPSYTGYATGRLSKSGRRQPQCTAFQSFLYWICYWKHVRFLATRPPYWRFNPSYTGYATGSFVGFNTSTTISTGFNPSYTGYATGRSTGLKKLFRGNQSFNPSYTGYATGSSAIYWNNGSEIICFNPSYTGYATGSAGVDDFATFGALFQSFLYWICYWKMF